jgi:hypothetical protein
VQSSNKSDESSKLSSKEIPPLGLNLLVEGENPIVEYVSFCPPLQIWKGQATENMGSKKKQLLMDFISVSLRFMVLMAPTKRHGRPRTMSNGSKTRKCYQRRFLMLEYLAGDMMPTRIARNL